MHLIVVRIHIGSQSPQTGQFNSYIIKKSFVCISFIVSIPSNGSIQFLPTGELFEVLPDKKSLNPLKRVNSILTTHYQFCITTLQFSLNPLKRVNSILTIVVSRRRRCLSESLNPLKRVNSILTYDLAVWTKKNIKSVSIPSNGSIQFLLG